MRFQNDQRFLVRIPQPKDPRCKDPVVTLRYWESHRTQPCMRDSVALLRPACSKLATGAAERFRRLSLLEIASGAVGNKL